MARSVARRGVGGHRIAVAIKRFCVKKSLVLSSDESTINVPMYDFDYKTQLSGISIERFTAIENLFRGDRKQVLKILEHIAFLDTVTLSKFSLSFVTKVIELVSVRSEFQLSFTFGNYSHIIDTLNKNRKSGSFCSRVRKIKNEDVKGLYDRIKYFKRFHCEIDKAELNVVLKDIFRSKSSFNLKELHFSFLGGNNWSNHFEVEGVTFTTLWKPTFSEDVIAKLWHLDEATPLSFRWAKLNNKYVVVLEHKGSVFEFEIKVVFVENMAKVWKCVFENLSVSFDDEEFFVAEEEEQQRRLTETYIENIMEMKPDCAYHECDSDCDS